MAGEVSAHIAARRIPWVRLRRSQMREWFDRLRRSEIMSKRAFSRFLFPGMVIVVGVILAATLGGVRAAQNKGGTLHVGSTDIGGVVTSPKGPEAGVWVIAETTELPTKFVKIVVTDDQGRYLVPDLPAANYSVWVRGYGLVGLAKLTPKPGRVLYTPAAPGA